MLQKAVQEPDKLEASRIFRLAFLYFAFYFLGIFAPIVQLLQYRLKR